MPLIPGQKTPRTFHPTHYLTFMLVAVYEAIQIHTVLRNVTD